MGSAPARVTAWSRRNVAAGVLFLLAWQGDVLLGDPTGAGVYLGAFGFVLHVVFGKAYSLVPSYFARSLELPRGPALQVPLTVAGVGLLAVGTVPGTPRAVRTAGALCWALGVGAFLAALGWSLRDNLSGAETGTGDHNADRRRLDRLANAFVPVAFAYVAVGSYELLAAATPLPTLLDGYPPRAVHLLGAGGAALLLFAVGFRLLPRFLVSRPPRLLPPVVLSAGALAPALLAASLVGGPAVVFRAGAVLEATAVLGFGAAVAVAYRLSDRRRLPFYAVLAGMAAGALGVALGLHFAFVGRSPGLVAAHRRLNLLGFLGLTILGLLFQFYPPSVGSFRGASTRTAAASLALLAGGLAVEVAGLVAGGPGGGGTGVGYAGGAGSLLVVAGRAAGLLGSGLYAYVLLGVFAEQSR